MTGLGTGEFYISDGCDILGGLPVKYLAGITPPSADQYVKVTGLVEADGMLVLRQSDISVVEEWEPRYFPVSRSALCPAACDRQSAVHSLLSTIYTPDAPTKCPAR